MNVLVACLFSRSILDGLAFSFSRNNGINRNVAANESVSSDDRVSSDHNIAANKRVGVQADITLNRWMTLYNLVLILICFLTRLAACA